MADDYLSIEIKLNANMVLINAALDNADVRRFKLACKHRRDLKAQLARLATEHTTAEV